MFFNKFNMLMIKTFLKSYNIVSIKKYYPQNYQEDTDNNQITANKNWNQIINHCPSLTCQTIFKRYVHTVDQPHGMTRIFHCHPPTLTRAVALTRAS